MATHEDIEHYLTQMGHPHETIENNVWIVRDAASIVIAYEPPVVIFRMERPEPEVTLYTVQWGDTLSKIAREHYGNPSKYPVIFEANQLMLKEPNKIYPRAEVAHPTPGALSLRRLGSHRIRWGILPDRGRIPLTSFPDSISPNDVGIIRRQPRRIPL